MNEETARPVSRIGPNMQSYMDVSAAENIAVRWTRISAEPREVLKLTWKARYELWKLRRTYLQAVSSGDEEEAGYAELAIRLFWESRQTGSSGSGIG